MDRKKKSNLLVQDFGDEEDPKSVDNSALDAEEESKNIGDERRAYDNFPDSDKDEEEEENDEGSEGIDEGFLQVASAGGSCNTGSF